MLELCEKVAHRDFDKMEEIGLKENLIKWKKDMDAGNLNDRFQIAI